MNDMHEEYRMFLNCYLLTLNSDIDVTNTCIYWADATQPCRKHYQGYSIAESIQCHRQHQIPAAWIVTPTYIPLATHPTKVAGYLDLSMTFFTYIHWEELFVTNPLKS